MGRCRDWLMGVAEVDCKPLGQVKRLVQVVQGEVPAYLPALPALRSARRYPGRQFAAGA